MEIKTTLLPGQNGTKSLLRQYGEQLVCVRYRYDKERRKRFKTVELIVDEQDWLPGVIIPVDKRVFVRIGYGETELREKIKAAGAYWDANKKAWHVSYTMVLRMGLEQRIIEEDLDL